MRGAILMALTLGALGAPTIAAAEPSSVVGQWRFDEGGGQTARDDGPYALDGRLGRTDGADPRDPDRIPGRADGALRFDGHASVRLPAAEPLTPSTLTLEAVVRADRSPGSYRYVVSHGAQGCVAGSYGLYTAKDGGIAFYVFDGDAYYLTAAVKPADVWNGAWHHVAGVFDGDAVRLFLDGRPVGTAFPARRPIAYTLTSEDHYFGTYEGTCALPFTGDLDLVRMWRGPLAADYLGTLSDAALGVQPTLGPPTDVPTADQSQSEGAAPAARSTVEPIAEGTKLSAPAAATSGGAVASRPGAPARACQVVSSAARVTLGRTTTITVRVALRGTPLKDVRVVAMAASRRRVAAGRTTATGRAKLKVKVARRGTIRVKVAGRPDCGAASLTVVKAKAK
jgi:hypothetical protein